MQWCCCIGGNVRKCRSPTPLRGSRGVQYVHWVMHKCIMVKVGGKRNTRKVCKKQVNLSKTEGKFVKVRGNNNFRETGRKCTETAKIGGKFEICSRLKKGHKKFRRMKIKKCVWKR